MISDTFNTLEKGVFFITFLSFLCFTAIYLPATAFVRNNFSIFTIDLDMTKVGSRPVCNTVNYNRKMQGFKYIFLIINNYH